ncbi:MAG: hypothetical protein QM724_03480 [Flavobacteriales bacterium]
MGSGPSGASSNTAFDAPTSGDPPASFPNLAPAGSKQPTERMMQKALPRPVERYLFLIAVLLNALPVLVSKYFPSMDGAAHLYNSRLIHELLFGQDDPLRLFYSFTAIPVPNWLGHFILTAALTILPAFLAEKMVVVAYVAGLPYAFRQLIRTISPRNVEYSFLILPFCYSYLFTLGFYNFSLALVLMLLTLAFWIRTDATPHTARTLGFLALLLTLLYFAHIFVFGLTLGMLGLHVVIHSVPGGTWQEGAWTRDMLRSMRPKLGRLACASAIPLILAFIYSRSMPSAPYYTFISRHELLEWLYTLRPIISYNMGLEGVYTQRIFQALVLLSIMSLFIFPAMGYFRRNGPNAVNATVINRRSALFWATSCLLLLLLYLLMPDGNGLAGYMSVRLGLLLFLFAIAALSLKRTPKWFTWAVILLVLYSNFELDRYYVSVVRDQNKVAMNCELACSHIPSGSIVFPIDRSGNWLGSHYSNYLGINKPLVILENYEAGTGYFPLRWNNARLPDLRLGRLHVADLIHGPWTRNDSRPERNVDHVFVLGDHRGFVNDVGNDVVKETLEHYTLIYANEDCAVYGPIGPSAADPARPDGEQNVVVPE